MVAIAANASKTVYLAPGAWDVADATERYALYMFDNTAGTNAWVSFTEGTDGIWSAEFDEQYPNMIICRMDAANTTNAWNSDGGTVWNQTADLAAPAASGLLYTITNIDTGAYTISVYGATAASFTDGGKYLFKNVGSGKYLGPGNNWGTQASLIAPSHYNTAHYISDGVYTIESQVSNGGTNYYFTGSFMDGGATNINISKLPNGNYLMSNGSTYFGYDGSSTVLASNLADYSADNAQWQIIGYDEALADATEENPVDATFMILDQNFDRNNRGKGAWTMVASNQNLSGGNYNTYSNNCAESWKAAFTLSQTITVPNGYYKVRAQAACWEYTETGADFPVVYAGDVTTPFNKMTDDSGGMDKFSERFLNGEYFTEWSDMITVTGKSLTVGVKGTRTDTWCIWDNIQLMYYGPIDLSGYQTALEEVVAKAQALEGKVPTVCYDAIAAAVTENNKTYETEDDYLAAINAIETAISTYAYDNLVAAYDRYLRIKAAVLAINADIDVTEADAAAEAATSNTAVDAAVPTLRAALTSYLATVVDQEIDITAAMIDNAAPGTAGNTDWWDNGGQSVGFGNGLAEFYNKEATTKQQLAPLPAGYYKMTVVGYTREGNGAYMFADGNTHALVNVAKATVNNLSQGNDWIAAGNGVNEFTFQLENDEPDLEIGIYTSATTDNDKWTAWRSFQLEYLGTAPLSVFDELLTAAIANGRTTVSALAVPTGVKNVFETVATKYETEKSTYTEASQFNAGITAIEEAVAVAQAAVAPAAENLNVQAKATTTKALEGMADDDAATLQAAIDTYDACTTVDEINAHTEALWTAIGTAINTIELTGDAQLDLTYLLTNPDVTGLPTWNKCDGWYTEQTGGNSQVMTNDGVATSDGKNAFYEYWSETAAANNKFTLYQKVSLPEGTYDISCYAFASPNGQSVTNSQVYFYANDTEGSRVASETLAEQGISFVNNAQQEVKIGLKAMTGNEYRWMGIGYMKLYKTAAKTFAISEADDYDTTQEGAGAVKLTRTIKANTWNTLWLPFSMTEAELKATFGDDVQIAQFSETPNVQVAGQSTIAFNKMTTPALSANVPVLLQTSTAGTAYTIEGRTIVAGTPTTTGVNFDFVGTTAASTDVAEGDYFIGSNKLYASAGATTLKGTRAYLKGNSDGARIINFSIDGNETTAIENLEQGTIITGKVYNLQGQEVKSAQKGLFIQNGKKVVIK